MRPIRIGLSGKAGSGKDTVAEYLIQNYDFVNLAFADKLKQVAYDLFGLNAQVRDRALLQALGNRMRQIDPAVWVHYVIKQLPLGLNVVVSDVRFLNEFEALKGLGFYMVRVERPLLARLEREKQLVKAQSNEVDDLELMGHDSETALDGIRDWYRTLHNVDTTQVLHDQVKHMISEIEKKHRKLIQQVRNV